jgi:hypothetical protein
MKRLISGDPSGSLDSSQGSPRAESAERSFDGSFPNRRNHRPIDRPHDQPTSHFAILGHPRNTVTKRPAQLLCLSALETPRIAALPAFASDTLSRIWMKFVTSSVPHGELFVSACNPVHHGVNANRPRATLSAFFVSRLSLLGLPHSRRLARVSVPNPSLPGSERDGLIGSKIGPKSLGLLRDDRHKLTTRSSPRPARDAPRSRDFWAASGQDHDRTGFVNSPHF